MDTPPGACQHRGLFSAPAPLKRSIFQADALRWLDQSPILAGCSLITSLPDVSEVPERGFQGWRDFFQEAARLCVARVPDDGVAIFFQSDIRHQGAWVDKGYLVARALEGSGMLLLWHKIVCRRPAGTVTFGRASYSHLLAFGRTPRGLPERSTADVVPDAGFMPWSKAMGVKACQVACTFVLRETPTRTIVDPFCGYGTVLAVANALGMDGIGVDLSARKCRRARTLTVDLGAVT